MMVKNSDRDTDHAKVVSWHSLFRDLQHKIKEIPAYESTLTYTHVIPLFEMLMEECRCNTLQLMKLTECK